jgi:hypothetical protein
VLNSGQEFYYLYKLIIDKSGNMGDLKEIIDDAIAYKNDGLSDKTFLISFTNENNYLKRFSDDSQVTCLEFMTMKKESDFQDGLAKFFQSSSKKRLFVFLRVLEDWQRLNYVISQIEKVRKPIQAFENVEDKKIRIVYWTCRDRVGIDYQKENNLSISHFTPY